MATLMSKNDVLERLVERKVADSLSNLLRDPELFMELSSHSKKRLALSLRSKKRIPFEVIRKKHG